MVFYIRLKRRKPKTLQDLCFLAVMSNFDEIISRPGSEAGMRVLQTNSQLLLKKLGELQVPEHRSIALFCVNRYLKELMFNAFHPDDVLPAVHKLTTVESTLIAFHMPFGLRLDILWQVVSELPETLQCLHLQKTICTDNMLEGIAQRYPTLRELNLMYCCNITDAGVQALCLKDEQGNICPNLVLETLNLLGTKVTREGILFALQNFPNLSEINSQYFEDVLCDMYMTRESSFNVSPLNLKSIHLVADGLKACSVLCPFVSVLRLTIYSQEDFDLLMQFRVLEKVNCFAAGFFDYFTFFEARGKTLKYLILYVCEEELAVPAEFIIKFCPRLEYLHLTCPFAEVKRKPVLDAQYTLQHLSVLQVEGKSTNFFEESVMLLLSCSPNLKKFVFKSVKDLLSVSFLNSLVQNISMSTLETFELLGANKLIKDEREFLKAMSEFEYFESIVNTNYFI